MFASLIKNFKQYFKKNPNTIYLTHKDPLIRELAKNKDLQLIPHNIASSISPYALGQWQSISLFQIKKGHKTFWLENIKIGPHYLHDEFLKSGTIYYLLVNDCYLPWNPSSNQGMATPYLDPVVAVINGD